MTRKKPQSADSHLYDRRALDYLKSLFPEHWKYVPVGDEDSQIEYGQDRIVQLTNENNQLDGAEFRVQNKGTKRKITKHGVSVPIAVSTLNLLRDVPLPVLLHFYHIPTETGYYIWLDDLFSHSKPDDWQKAKKVLVTIPITNVLNTEAVEEIRERVLSLCRLQAMVKHAQSETLNDPHYKWELELHSDGLSINQIPKHADAPPMEIDLNISDELRELLTEAWETGITIHTNGVFPLQGAPDWVRQVFEGKETEFFLTPPKRVIYAQLRFFKHVKDRRPYYDTGTIELKFKRKGSKVAVTEGIGPDGITVFGFHVDIRNIQRVGRRFKLDGGVYVIPDPTVTDVVRIDECYSFIEELMSAEKVLYFDPLQRMTLRLEHTSSNQPVEESQFRRIIHNLATIQRDVGIKIAAPKVHDEMQFRYVEFVAHVLQTGRSPMLLLTWTEDSPRPDDLHLLATPQNEDDVQNLLADLSTENEYHTLPGVSEFHAEVYNNEILLGPTEHVMKLIRCKNADELRQELTANDVIGKTLDVLWEVDWEASYTKFPRFSKE